MNKKIFTFWEPKSNIPGYIQVCMETWRKFLPDYQIVVLDYENLEEYLPDGVIRKILEKRMDLAMQSDCIRCAVLKYHGGIWIDADTIITNSNIFKQITKTKCHMIGRKADNALYGAFIYTNSPQTLFINSWYNELVKHVRLYRFCSCFKAVRFLFRKLYSKTRNWDWCVNSIVDPLSKTIYSPDFDYTDKDEIGALPEFLSPMAKNVRTVSDKIDLYKRFYFEKGNYKNALANTQGIILLHNSWTPKSFKQMDPETFMATDTMLAKLLKAVLNKNDK